APWKRANPRNRAGKASKHLSAAAKSSAKQRAKRAGRPYPNLVDNMRVASKKKTTTKSAKKRSAKKTAKKPAKTKKSAKKKSAKKRAGRNRKPEKDPRGGLTAAGRR